MVPFADRPLSSVFVELVDEISSGFNLSWRRVGSEQNAQMAPQTIIVEIYSTGRSDILKSVQEQIGAASNGMFYLPYIPYSSRYLFVYGRNRYGRDTTVQFVQLTAIEEVGR